LPEKIYTTYQIGKFCQVNIRTVIRWIETGKMKAYSTPGGHRRVKWSDLMNFLTENRMPIPKELEEAKKRKILVVDDDPDFLYALRLMLEKGGYVVVTAESAEDGLKAYRQQTPDAVLVDLMMEEVDAGVSFVKELKALSNNAPVYMLSSAGDSFSETAPYAELGLAGVLQKPIDQDELMTLLRAKL